MTEEPKKYTAQEIEAAMRDINRIRKANQKNEGQKLERARWQKLPFANKSNKVDFDKIDTYSIESLSNIHRKFKLNITTADISKKQWLKDKLEIVHQALVKKGLYYVPPSKTRDSLGRYRAGYYRAYP